MKFRVMPYERVDFDEVERQIKDLIGKFDEAKSGAEQFELHKEFYRINGRVITLYTIAHIRFDADMTNEFYKGEKEFYDEKLPLYDNLVLEYQKKLYASPFRKELEGFIGPVAFRNMELAAKAMDEKLIPLMQEENALSTEYSMLIAGAKIPFQGEELNLSLLRPHLVSPDREVRKAAWQAMSSFFRANADQLDEIYDKLVKNRTEQAKKMGYENYVELGYYRMGRNCYGKEEVEAFRSQVKEYLVPFAEKLHEKRRKRLGLDKLKLYDASVFYADGNAAPKGTPEEILEAGRQMYSELSPETREFYDFMMDNGLFDVFGRKNKRAGGYMTYMPDYNSPFVFANFNGTSSDVDVITHECGHAFQGYLSGTDPVREHADVGMETAEIHSMSMEFFTQNWMNLFFGEDADKYIQMHLEDAVCFIPYGCMVDEFQHIVYEHPEMTPAERNQTWLELEKVYRPHMDFDDDPYFGKGGFWQKQTHIYNSPFYYIDYCLAQTCALQYKVKMDEDFAAAWESYLLLCKLSASDFFTNMIRQVGLNSPFEPGCMKTIVEKLEAYV